MHLMPTHAASVGSRLVLSAGVVALLTNLAQAQSDQEAMANSNAGSTIEQSTFGQLPDGREVESYRLTNANGVELQVINYGGTIVSLKVPDAEGNMDDIVLGFDSLDDYLSDTYQQANPYFGALIGRYGNRIAEGQFTLEGETYTLATNDGDNHLHGGEQGFDRVLWQAEPFENDAGTGLVLRHLSEDGEEGYPGELAVEVTYTLTDQDELIVDYQAETDKTTPINLTQHSYFNLKGEGNASILDHQLMLNADAFTPVSEALIPTGELRDVAGTPFDFTQATPIGERIDQDNDQLRFGQGYDHNFVLNRDDAEPGDLVMAARVWEPQSGRVLEIETTEPGIQFYSGNFLTGDLIGKNGQAYPQRSGFALETQHFPDSPNQDGFPSTLLQPGETYRSRTLFRFSVQSDMGA
ncbi:galactose mutarotase [Halomonas aquamarina]|uniref:Galactose mutarotase n=1 Tax=Vreelandella aquamarina TaxID=77097 RepID=A0ACC5VWY2_9GAMM|nr:galactose mutarotase [Halomonas aquamarina]